MGLPHKSETSAKASSRLGLAALTLALTLPALTLFAWSRPLPIPPAMPPLAPSPEAVASQLAADLRAAAEAHDDELARERQRRFREANEAELSALDSPARAQARAARLRGALEQLVEAHGEEARVSARARDLEDAEAVLRSDADDPRRAPRLGGFLAMARRYGMVQRSRQIAPRFVLRTVFKARWNTQHGRPLTEALSGPELQAYWGWLALHASDAPLALRLEGLGNYEEAGGPRANEARAALLAADGRTEEATEAAEAAWQSRPTFRLRNVQRGLDVGTGESADPSDSEPALPPR